MCNLNLWIYIIFFFFYFAKQTNKLNIFYWLKMVSSIWGLIATCCSPEIYQHAHYMAGKNSLPNDIHISMQHALEDSSQKKKKKKDQKRGRYRRKIDNKIEETWKQEFLVQLLLPSPPFIG